MLIYYGDKMLFPEIQRVIYKKNPLDQVICQVRFPSILKIDAEIPADFQDRIRGEFPNFSEKSELKLEVPRAGKGQEVPLELLRGAQQSLSTKNYEFISEDNLWRINLTRTFLALTSNKYERWEDFKGKLLAPLNALIEIYAPIHFSRIGLRYIDVIKRSGLGLIDSSWGDLIQPYILGILDSPTVSKHVQSFENRYEISLSEHKDLVTLSTKFVVHVGDGETCYMIDADFSNAGKVPVEGAIEKLDYFNKHASRLLRWCITDRLHQAMEPQAL